MKLYAKSSVSRDVGEFYFRMNRYTAGVRLPEHAYPDAYLCFVVSGDYREWSQGRLTLHAAGTVHFHTPGDSQYVEIGSEGAACISISYSGNAPQLARPIVEPLGFAREELISAFHDSSYDSEKRLSRVAFEFLHRVWGSDRLPPLWLQIVESNLRESKRPVIASLAQEVGVHPVHLWKSFRRWYGLTPGDYSRRVKLDRATSMLVETTMPLSAIAAETGFSDESHFIRAFKHTHKTTPAKYRQAASG